MKGRLLGRVWAVRKGRRYVSRFSTWTTRIAMASLHDEKPFAKALASLWGGKPVALHIYAAHTPKPRKPR